MSPALPAVSFLLFLAIGVWIARKPQALEGRTRSRVAAEAAGLLFLGAAFLLAVFAIELSRGRKSMDLQSWATLTLGGMLFVALQTLAFRRLASLLRG